MNWFKHHQIFISLPLVASIIACSHMPMASVSEQHIDQWIVDKKYAKAYQAIQKQQENNSQAIHSNSTQQLLELEKQSAVQWNTLHAQANTFASKQQWKQAKEILDIAIETLIDPIPAAKTLENIFAEEEKALYELRVDEAIVRGKWLSKEYRLQLALSDSTQASVLAPITLQQLKSKQQGLAEELIQYAHTAINQSDTQKASQCYDTLNQILVPDALSQQVAEIGQQLSQNKKNHLVYQQNKLINQLDSAIKSGQLVESTQIIEQLKKLTPLPKAVLIKIDAVNSVLAYNAEFLDEKADIYYRDGNVELASSLWEYLLKLKPDNTDIQLKLTRSEKVIKNMQELREGGHKAIN